MIHRESTIKIPRNGFQESSRRGNVREIILLDISSAMNFTIRSTFISKETRNGSFHGKP